MASNTTANETTQPPQPQASNQSDGGLATQNAPPAPQSEKPEPKLPGIHHLREGSDRSTQTVWTLTETQREK